MLLIEFLESKGDKDFINNLSTCTKTIPVKIKELLSLKSHMAELKRDLELLGVKDQTYENIYQNSIRDMDHFISKLNGLNKIFKNLLYRDVKEISIDLKNNLLYRFDRSDFMGIESLNKFLYNKGIELLTKKNIGVNKTRLIEFHTKTKDLIANLTGLVNLILGVLKDLSSILQVVPRGYY